MLEKLGRTARLLMDVVGRASVALAIGGMAPAPAPEARPADPVKTRIERVRARLQERAALAADRRSGDRRDKLAQWSNWNNWKNAWANWKNAA